ncbi:MAG: alpha/beta hydrolase-fold protein [Erysipelotrichaceae bacterium]|nr:alpha/beta hydrolase-fold protein [Erysipelotrichaceae bacterium]MDP3306385.1 alpha/beta hydrolase-fold protein [Erysipelotrichaceae bacterium]
MNYILEEHQLNLAFSGRDAAVFVYRPENVNEVLPCLIMHDGQNLFDDDRASFGFSWKLREAIETYDLQLMVVGVSCADGLDRLDEYSPFYNRDIVGLREWLTRPAGGLGNEYIDWIVNDLIVWIKERYAVEDSFLMTGSSMGGLISMVAMCRYPQIFSRIACLSNALWFAPAEMAKLIESSTVSGNVVYMDVGLAESQSERENQAYLDTNRKIASIWTNKGLSSFIYREVAGAIHSESAWSLRIGRILSELLVENR